MFIILSENNFMKIKFNIQYRNKFNLGWRMAIAKWQWSGWSGEKYIVVCIDASKGDALEKRYKMGII